MLGVSVYKYLFFITGAFSILLAVWLRSTLQKITPDTEYDYIIVGAGTAGCVLANKLSERKDNKVLLIEAGDEFGLLASVPLFATMLQGSKYDWTFKTVTQKYSSFGLFDHSQSIPRGKGLGGSGMINYMIHGNAVLDEFTNWNIKRWDYENLHPYLTNNKCAQNNEDFCPLRTQYESPLPLVGSGCELTDHFLEAFKELNNSKITFHHTNITVKNGQRTSSYHEYLKNILDRKNLHILTNTRVTKIFFSNTEAVGIHTIDINGKKFLIQSRRDIILSAGAIHSPQLLLSSGVGPRYLLQDLGIKMITEVPGVGRNLHDHLNMPLYVSLQQPVSLTVDKVMTFRQFYNYIFNRNGYLSTTPIAGILKGTEGYGLLLFGMGSTDEKILREIANFRPEIFRSLFPLYKNSSQEGFVFLSNCLQPKSRGYVSISSTDPSTPPVIDPNYLSHNDDIDCTIKAMSLVVDVLNTSVFKELGAKLHWPKLKNCEHLPVDPKNYNYLDCIIRTVALTAHHPAGTCRIGTDDDDMAVVDGYLRVKGTKGLRVMDASILPKPISTFPNDILINLAEYASHLILNDEE